MCGEKKSKSRVVFYVIIEREMLLSTVERSLPIPHLSKIRKGDIFMGFCSKPLLNYLQSNSPLCYPKRVIAASELQLFAHQLCRSDSW